jgi:very-short-patch-repair endonuclease
VFSHAQAREQGLTSDQIRHRVRSGRWERLARGYYRRAAADWLDEFARARRDHVDRAVAAASRHRTGVVALRSAAIFHELPLFWPVPREVSLFVPYGHWAGRRSGVVFHHSDLDTRDVLVQGVQVTTVDRTWLDVARTRPLADALAVGDAAARAGLVEVETLRGRASALRESRGCRRAALAAAHVDARRETPLESGSWAYFVQHAIPLPRMQVSFADEVGDFVGRVDFYWEEAAVVGECDGLVKYDSRRALFAEKRREDALRALGLRVVRWGWRDLRDPRLAATLRRQVR